MVSPGDDVYRSIPSRKMLFERLLRGTRCTRGDGNPRSAGADYIGALDSACLEGDSADTVQGARPAAARPARDAAAACSDGRCANASIHHYAPPPGPILPLRPTAWTAMRLKRPIDGPASGRSKVVFFLLACCMQEASRKNTTLERPLAGPATVRFKRVAVHADGRIGKYSPSGARGVYRFRLYSKK